MSVKIEGMAELMKALESMGQDVDQKAVAALTTTEAQKIVYIARSYIPEDSGLAKMSIKIVGTKNNKGFTGTLAGIDWHSEHGYLAHILEFGTAPRFTKDGKYTGQIAPVGFMRRAFDSSRNAASEAISSGMVKLIRDLAKKNNLKIK
jgi:HK97 gp10 family phage protein